MRRVALLLITLGLLMAITAAPVAAGAPAVLVMDKSDSVDPVLPGGTLFYTIVVENVGQADATHVSVNDSFPAGVTAISAVVSQGSVSFFPGFAFWAVGTLADGEVATMTVLVTVAALPPGTVLTNTATGTSDQTRSSSPTRRRPSVRWRISRSPRPIAPTRSWPGARSPMPSPSRTSGPTMRRELPGPTRFPRNWFRGSRAGQLDGLLRPWGT